MKNFIDLRKQCEEAGVMDEIKCVVESLGESIDEVKIGYLGGVPFVLAIVVDKNGNAVRNISTGITVESVC